MPRTKKIIPVLVSLVEHDSRTFEAVVDNPTTDPHLRRVVIYEHRDPARRVLSVSAFDTRKRRILSPPPGLPDGVCAELEAGLAETAA